MRKILLSAAMLMSAVTINAQWQSNGDSIYYNEGNVGIGTTSPDASLDVAGFKFGGSTENHFGPDNLFVVGGHSSQFPKSDFVHNQKWSTNGAYWASPMIYRSMRYPDNGTGAFPFDQYGELILQGTSHGSNLQHGLYNMGISFATWDGTTSDPSIKMRLNENGYLGLGTVSPATKLHAIDSNSNLSFGEKDNNAQLRVGNNTSEGYAGLILDAADGDAVGSDYFGIYQDKNLNLNLESMYHAGDIVFMTKKALGQSPDKESMRITKSGNVGIGTSEPLEKLHLDGGLILGNSTQNNSGTIRWNGTDFEGNKSGSWTSLTGSSLWEQQGTDVFLSSGNVGIGTSTPQTQLHVERPAHHANGATLYLKHGNVGSHLSQNNSGGVLHLYDGDSISQTILRSYGNSYINALRGYVGIGTTEPTAKLQIADGDIFISDIDKGIIMKSPDGTCWRGTMDNSGQLVFTSIDCPDTPAVSSIEEPQEFKTESGNISIYPNPASESVFIEAEEFGMSENIKGELFSMNGQLVKNIKLDGRFTKLDISDLSAGVYIMKMSSSNGKVISVKEIIKQ